MENKIFHIQNFKGVGKGISTLKVVIQDSDQENYVFKLIGNGTVIFKNSIDWKTFYHYFKDKTSVYVTKIVAIGPLLILNALKRGENF